MTLLELQDILGERIRKIELRDRCGNRLIVKIKARDFN